MLVMVDNSDSDRSNGVPVMKRQLIQRPWGIMVWMLTPVIGLAMAATLSGCLLVAAAAGTGATVAYVRGDLKTSIDADPKRVVDAAERAMKDMDIAVISKQSSSIDGKVVGRTARDVKLDVTIKGQSERVSTVYIRAGVFGDQAMQSNLLEKIQSELGRLPSSTMASTTAPATQPAMASTQHN